jgi:hypothetical protein
MRVMARTSYLYIGVMALAGLTLGTLDHRDGVTLFALLRPLFCLVLVSFLFDGLIQFFGGRLRLPPLAMAVRLGGFLSGALLYCLVTLIFGTPDLAA